MSSFFEFVDDVCDGCGAGTDFFVSFFGSGGFFVAAVVVGAFFFDGFTSPPRLGKSWGEKFGGGGASEDVDAVLVGSKLSTVWIREYIDAAVLPPSPFSSLSARDTAPYQDKKKGS